MIALGPQGPVRIGISTGVWPYGFPDSAWWRRFFRRVEEEWGFDCLMAIDRPSWPHPTYDPLSLMALATALTERVEVAAILLLPYRSPFIVAKEAASIDHFSGGRTVLALGVGGDYPLEFYAAGVLPKQRPSRLEEGMEVMRRLWSGQAVTWQGRYARLEAIQQLPAPARPIPLWLAHRARAEVSLERTARLGDGWLASWVSPGRLARGIAAIRERAAAYHRDPAAITIAQWVRIYVADDTEQAADQVARFRQKTWGHPYQPDLVKHLQAVGTPEQCREKLAAFMAAGAERIYLQLECPFAEWEEQMRRLQQEVLTPLDFTR